MVRLRRWREYGNMGEDENDDRTAGNADATSETYRGARRDDVKTIIYRSSAMEDQQQEERPIEPGHGGKVLPAGHYATLSFPPDKASGFALLLLARSVA